MTTSNVERLRELYSEGSLGRFDLTESSERVLTFDDGRLYNIAEFSSPSDAKLYVAARNCLPALLEIASTAQELMNPYPSNGFGGQYAMADNELDAKKKLEAAIAKFNSLKIDGL